MDETEVKVEHSDEIKESREKPKEEPEEEAKYFECSSCFLKEKYEYFGNRPPFYKKYKLLENVYAIEDPFQAPKQGEILVLGSHCVKCGECVCKDSDCSFYFNGTYCLKCAKESVKNFPEPLQRKLNKIIKN